MEGLPGGDEQSILNGILWSPTGGGPPQPQWIGESCGMVGHEQSILNGILRCANHGEATGWVRAVYPERDSVVRHPVKADPERGCCGMGGCEQSILNGILRHAIHAPLSGTNSLS